MGKVLAKGGQPRPLATQFKTAISEKMLKYQRWYDSLIKRARTRMLDCYCERHHILPRACGGGDEPSNLVVLTYREHFLAHWLLTKILAGSKKRSMVHALHAMTMQNGRRIVTSWQFDVAKRALANAVAERQRERARRKQAAEDKSLALQIQKREAESAVVGGIMERTPWRARRVPTVLAAQEAVKESIRDKAPLLGISSNSGRRTANALATVWIECSKGTRRLNRHRRKRPSIKFSESLKQTLREIEIL